jgi:hypothetical protein
VTRMLSGESDRFYEGHFLSVPTIAVVVLHIM